MKEAEHIVIHTDKLEDLQDALNENGKKGFVIKSYSETVHQGDVRATAIMVKIIEK